MNSGHAFLSTAEKIIAHDNVWKEPPAPTRESELSTLSEESPCREQGH